MPNDERMTAERLMEIREGLAEGETIYGFIHELLTELDAVTRERVDAVSAWAALTSDMQRAWNVLDNALGGKLSEQIDGDRQTLSSAIGLLVGERDYARANADWTGELGVTITRLTQERDGARVIADAAIELRKKAESEKEQAVAQLAHYRAVVAVGLSSSDATQLQAETIATLTRERDEARKKLEQWRQDFRDSLARE